MRIARETTLLPVPHLTCVYHTEAEIYDILERYAQAGIENLLALGGDIPRSRPNYDRSRDAFRYAEDLVRFVGAFKGRQGGRAIKDPRGFGIGVAGYPEGHPGCPNRLLEMDYLKRKVDAGASYIVTQLFFDNRDFYDFRERCELAGIKVPIVAGIMPVTSEPTMRRICELALGSRLPAKLMRALARAGSDKDSFRRVGVHWATEQCRDLLDHSARGIHLYTLNSSTATREIYANLGVKDSLALT
jgi:methylenetetrahydrofolate reductase (NADPH)